MRIFVIGINYWPEDTGIGPYNTGRCEYLAARGHDVTMITGFPYYPQWRVPPGYRSRFFAREERGGVEIVRSYLYVPERVTSVKRVLHEASFVASATAAAFGRRKPDVLLTVSPPLGLAATSVLLSGLWKVPYVFHVPDLQPDAAMDLGMIPAGRIARGLYALERLAYRRAALVSTLTEAMRARIVSKGVPGEKVTLLSDWADPDLFDVPIRGGGEAFRRAFEIEDRFLVVHAGNMGVKQGLDVVLEAARRTAEHPDLLYILVGDGAARPHLEARARSLGLTNLRFLPLQPKDRFLELLAAADVALVTQQASVADIVFPSKVLALLAAGRSVIASVSSGSEVARVLTRAGSGRVVPAEDADALSEAVLAVRRDADASRAIARGGRDYARENWARESLLPRMEGELLRVIGARAPSVASAANRVMGARIESESRP